MDQLRITGMKKLNGSVQISQAKNALLPILKGTLLCSGKVRFSHLPALRDIDTTFQLLKNLGLEVEKDKDTVTINPNTIKSFEATYDLVKTMRASILVLGPLLARYGKAKVSLTGGCAIGAIPIDIHLEGMEKLGAKIKIHSGYVEAEASRLIGAKIVLPFPSVGATENIMMAAALAKGETVIENCAKEPEIEDLANFLIKMGAKIEGAGGASISIQGVDELKGVSYRAIGDRIEAATYLMAGLITRGDVTATDVVPRHLGSVLQVLEDMGAKIVSTENSIRATWVKPLEATNITTAPFPGFPTDVQAQLMALCTQVEGTSLISETIFENRFMHVPELKRLGADIELKGNTAIIKGPTKLTGAPVMCTDLRASAALVLSALAGEGESVIQRIYHLDRGYNQLDSKLRSLGAQIIRENNSRND
jgi:UDP-N-acetylglucosamine 1-carboxyvinyltransferase